MQFLEPKTKKQLILHFVHSMSAVILVTQTNSDIYDEAQREKSKDTGILKYFSLKQGYFTFFTSISQSSADRGSTSTC